MEKSRIRDRKKTSRIRNNGMKVIFWEAESIQSARLCSFPCRPNWVPHPLTHRRVLLSLLWVQGGKHTRIRGEEVGAPMPTMGQTFWYWYSRYTIIFLHACTLHNWTYASMIVEWILLMKPDLLKSYIASGTVVHDLRHT
jgi:hypothetical protein